MKQLVFATNNSHKLEEVKSMVQLDYRIVSLSEIGCFDEIPETEQTLEGNALLKAQYIFDKYKMNCFADDTGLEIEALDGRPGVYSARYAGSDCIAANNIDKVLKEMQYFENRKACFRTVIALIIDGNSHFFEGKVEGHILRSPSGLKGFGYDPIFMPIGYSGSFAELSPDIKNQISHRALAVKNLINHLNH